MLSIFEKVDCTIDSDFIDDYHCCGKSNDRVIVKFIRSKNCKQVLQVFSGLNLDDLDLPRGTEIFINQSLCPCYHILQSKSK